MKLLYMLLCLPCVTPLFAADMHHPRIRRSMHETCMLFKDDSKGHARQILVNDRTCETGLRWKNQK